MDTPLLYFEDFPQGAEYELGPWPVEREDVIEFASEFDPQPMHLDEEAGKESLLGGLAASGWHTCAMVMRMMAEAYILRSSAQGAPKVDYVRWKRPVMPGDTLRGTSRVVSARPLNSRPGIGVVQLEHEIRNQRGEVVCESANPTFFGMRERDGSQ